MPATRYELDVDYTARAQAEVNHAIADLNRLDRAAARSRSSFAASQAGGSFGFGGEGIKAKKTGFDLFGVANLGRGGFSLGGGALFKSPIGGKLITGLALLHGGGAVADIYGDALLAINTQRKRNGTVWGSITAPSGADVYHAGASAVRKVADVTGLGRIFGAGMKIGAALTGKTGEEADRFIEMIEKRLMTGGRLPPAIKAEIDKQVNEATEKRERVYSQSDENLIRSWGLPAARTKSLRVRAAQMNHYRAASMSQAEGERAKRVATGLETGEGN